MVVGVVVGTICHGRCVVVVLFRGSAPGEELSVGVGSDHVVVHCEKGVAVGNLGGVWWSK